MKIEFPKRTKNPNKAALEEQIRVEKADAGENPTDQLKKAQFQFPTKVSDRTSLPSQRHGNFSLLDKKFEEQKRKGQDTDHAISEKRKELEILESNFRRKQSHDTLDAPNPSSNGDHIWPHDRQSFHKDPEDEYLSKLIQYEQKIMNEQLEKPLWSAGIVELEISQAARLGNIIQCEDLLFGRLKQIVKEKLFKPKTLLIPEEDIIATGDLWAKPKKLRQLKADDDIKKKIRKSLSSVFGSRRKPASITPNPLLKIE